MRLLPREVRCHAVATILLAAAETPRRAEAEKFAASDSCRCSRLCERHAAPLPPFAGLPVFFAITPRHVL